MCRFNHGYGLFADLVVKASINKNYVVPTCGDEVQDRCLNSGIL